MGLLARSPLAVRGTLTRVHLFNFSLDPSEIRDLVPRPLTPVIHRERAWISLVSVQLRHMRPAFLPFHAGVGYHHLAYRLLVDCPTQNADGRETALRGIYFLNSFAARPWAALGRLVSEYAFMPADIAYDAGNDGLHITLDHPVHAVHLACWYDEPERKRLRRVTTAEAIDLVGPLTRAFSVDRGRPYQVGISREAWPLQSAGRAEGSLGRFPTARLEAALRVPDAVHYRWDRARPVTGA